MEITEVRIKLMEDNSGSNERLQAFCSITFDDMFVIRDLKIIEGAKGFFVAMPSRKLTDRCHHCGTKNHLRSRFCNQSLRAPISYVQALSGPKTFPTLILLKPPTLAGPWGIPLIGRFPDPASPAMRANEAVGAAASRSTRAILAGMFDMRRTP